MAATLRRLPSPPPSPSQPSLPPCASRDSHSLTRERQFASNIPLMELFVMLRNERATGTILIDVHDGGVGGIRFREERRIEPR